MMLDKKYPLWLPPGSGRLIMALGIVGAAVAACFAEVNATGLGFLMGLSASVVKSYFESRKDEARAAREHSHQLATAVPPRADTP